MYEANKPVVEDTAVNVDNFSVKNEKLKKRFKGKKLLPIIFAIFVVGGLGYAGYLGYMSHTYTPYKVMISNIADNSFTVSWVTDREEKGIVYYKEGDQFLPGFLTSLGTKRAYDDRDFSLAQTSCIEEYNLKTESDSDFNISMDDFDCEDTKVNQFGSYYSHHVTLRNLESDKTYYFKIGDGFWTWKPEENSAITFEVSEQISSPEPIFGKVLLSEYVASEDTIVYGKFVNHREDEESQIYSSVTNEQGGWFLDSSNVRTEDGEKVTLEDGLDMVYIVGQFANFKLGDVQKWLFGVFDAAYPDIYVSGDLFDKLENEKTLESSDVLGIWDWAKGIITGDSSSSSSDSSSTDTPVLKSSASQATVASSRTPEQGSAIQAANMAASYTGRTAKELEKQAEDTSKSVAERSNASAKAALLNTQVTNIANSITKISNGSDGSEDLINYFTGSKTTAAVKTKIQEELGTQDNAKYFATPSTTNSGNTGANNTAQTPEEVKTSLSTYADEKLLDENGEEIEDETERRNELCPSCSSFVTSEQMLDILKNPNPKEASKYQNIIGAGNLARIFAEAGILIDKTVMENYLGLAYNAGNINALSINALRANPTNTISQSEVEENGNIYTLDKNGINKTSYVPETSITSNADNLNDQTSSIKAIIQRMASTALVNSASGEYLGSNGAPIGQNPSGTDGIMSEDDTKTNKLIFSNAAFKLPIKFTENGLVVTTYKGEYAPPSLSYNTDTNEYEIADITGLVQYSLASIFETSAFFTTDTIAEALKDIPIVKLQRPIAVSSSEVEDGVTETTVSLKSPIKLKDREDHWLWGSVIDVFEFISNKKRVAEESILSQVCIKNNSSKRSECNDTGVNIVMIEAEESSPQSKLFPDLIKNVYASTEVEDGDDFIFYTSERGLVDISVNGVKVINNTESSANDFFLFYIEVNGEEGYQIPENWKSPGPNDDKVISSKAIQVEFEKKSGNNEVILKKGINLISFNFLPLRDGGNVMTARDLLNRYQTQIGFIGMYSSGKWTNIIRGNDESVEGIDFEIIPGKGYVIFSKYDTTLSLAGNSLKTPMPFYLSMGWNLIGVNGYQEAFTAKTLMNSVNQITGLTADNISHWPTSLGRYEGLQVVNDTYYGLDYPVDNKSGYFIRVTELESDQKDCKTVIWNKGSQFHGECGSTSL